MGLNLILRAVLFAHLFNVVALQNSTSQNEIPQSVAHIATNCSARPISNNNISCWTLSKYLSDMRNGSNSDNKFQSLILYVLPGNHQFDDVLSISQSYSHLVLMRAPNSSTIPTISCTNQGHFEFTNLASLYISGLDFISCAGNKFIDIENVTIVDSTFLGSDSMYTSYITESGLNESNYLGQNLRAITVINSSVSVRMCAFQNNIAGALFFEFSDVSIAECHFENNTALYFGGAIVSLNSSVLINTSSFVNNRAAIRLGDNRQMISNNTAYGGAVHVNSDNNITINSSQFINNTATYGGAVGVYIDNNIAVHSSQFTNNHAENGGAMHVNSDNNITLNSSKLINNNVEFDGGAVYVTSDNNIIVHSSQFTNNNAAYGGVVYVNRNNNITVQSSQFTNNNAENGGAVHVNSDNNVAINSSQFTNNTATYGGAVGVHIDNNIAVHSSQFTNNHAENGGAMHVNSDNNITFNSSQFSNNNAMFDGGVVYVASDNIIIVDSSKFTNNNVQFDGGAVYVTSVNDIIVHSSQFTNNNAAYGGAVYVNSDNNVRVHYSQFTNNSAENGGAVHVNINNNISINSTQFTNNTATYGGAVGVHIDNILITVDSSQFTYNNAAYDGGAVYVNSDNNIIVYSSHFYNNTAVWGGAVYVNSDNNITVGHSSQFTSNNAENDGGAMHIESGNCVIVHSSHFNNNNAETEAGAVYVDSDNNIRVYCSQFTNNNAKNGGAVYVAIHNIMTVNSSQFNNNNAAENGGAVGIALKNNVFVHFSEFNNNNASRYGGGAVVGNDNNVFVHSSLFTANTATDRGGAVYMHRDNDITVSSSSQFNNNNARDGGAVYVNGENNVSVNFSNFTRNLAIGDGGAVYVTSNSIISVHSSKFTNNSASVRGGAVCAESDNNISVNSSEFTNNLANNDGGAIYMGSDNNTVIIICSNFTRNRALRDGGVAYLSSTNFTVVNSNLSNNSARDGGVFYVVTGILKMRGNNNIFNNSAEETLMKFIHSSMNTNGISTIKYNIGSIYIFNSNVTFEGDTKLISNRQPETNKDEKQGGAISCTFRSNLIFTGSTEIMYNYADYGGAISAIESKIFFSGNTKLSYNTARLSGGGIYAHKSEVDFKGSTSEIKGNTANEKGGGMFAITSTISLSGGSLAITDNMAVLGGGMNLEYNAKVIVVKEKPEFVAEFVFKLASEFTHFAEMAGAAANQSAEFDEFAAEFAALVNLATKLANLTELTMLTDLAEWDVLADLAANLTELVAELVENIDVFSANNSFPSLAEASDMYAELTKLAELTQLAEQHLVIWIEQLNSINLLFINNTASQFGGAVYIADNTTCTATNSQSELETDECFFQQYATYSPQSIPYGSDSIVSLISTIFENNKAAIAGGTLYGGLLDRCRVSPFVENFIHNFINASGLSYFLNVTNVDDNQSISSSPVRICFCKDDQPDCDYQPPPVYVKKGHPFNLSLVAVDQVLKPISQWTIIHSSVSSTDAILSEKQDRQLSYGNCTPLQYNIISPNPVEQLLLYTEGPCKDVGISQRMVEIHFTECICPIGFEPSSSTATCSCICNSDIDPYVIECFSSNQTLLRKQSSWINYTNSTDSEGYITSSYCPFDFCYPADQLVYVNLSIANGSDSQCAFNRSGILCGSCKEGLSLTFGRSHCKPCSNYWIALLIPFVLAGIALVVFVLICNLTVAAGTINGLIFYANVVIANRAIFFTIDDQNILTVFIAWLNLDVGIETCFYDGMNAYAKIWLQLVFPAYIIFLIVLIIVISECSQRFANLIGEKNPIATLATLFLLSYAKLLRTIIAIVSYSNLMYSDNSTKTIWLFDGKIGYLSSIHIPLFIAAIIIVVIALGYTVLLLSWQWLLYYSKWKCFKWVNNTKLKSLMDAYHTPYQPRHRYWFGLLLLVRVILYLVSALNQFGDPNVNLVSIVCTTILLLLLSMLVYRNSGLRAFNTSILLNLCFLAVGTLFNRINESGSGKQITLIYMSVVISFTAFLAVIAYHCYIIFFKDTMIARGLKTLYERYKQKLNRLRANDIGYDRLEQIEDDRDNSQFREDLDIFPPPTIEDYRQLEACEERLRKEREAEAQQKITYSVVEIPKPV